MWRPGAGTEGMHRSDWGPAWLKVINHVHEWQGGRCSLVARWEGAMPGSMAVCDGSYVANSLLPCEGPFAWTWHTGCRTAVLNNGGAV